MNNQLKLLLYIVFVVSIFYLIQNKFEIFDVSLENVVKTEQKEDVKGEEKVVEEDSSIEIYTSGGVISVDIDIADDATERQLGLSGRRNLGDYEGMLFIFEQEGNFSFWMKDMEINLDMIFIDEEKFVVDIRENLEPCSENFCPSIYSRSSFMYNLEVNSGFVEKNGIGIGDSVDLNLSN